MTALITLIPNSGLHFWDVDIDLDTLPRLVRYYWEERLSDVPDETGKVPVLLHELSADDNGEVVDPQSGLRPPEEETYGISVPKALEPFLAKWVPLPIFVVLARRADRGEEVDRGPTNWVRLRLAELPPGAVPGMARPARLTLCFDTELLEREADPDAPFVAPSPQTAERQQELAFTPETARNGWFLNEEWIGSWLQEMLVELKEAQRPGRALRPQDLPWSCEHLARYITFLALLDELDAIPRIRLVDTVSPHAAPAMVEVDLVLDVGNSRTCGVLVEEHVGQGMNLTDSMPLVLRDLSHPEESWAKPFDSRLEFVRAVLGRDAISRRSGRSGAFSWPSPARVGPEAVRLAGARLGNEGATGLSSPKRYLWDERPVAQAWRFNGRGTDGVTTDPQVGGAFMRLVAENGEVLSRRAGTPRPAMRPHFSRSSLFSFLLAEIVLQAVCQANAPGGRMQRRDAEAPRRLRRVVLTMPPGMPLAEQKLLRARAESGVRLAWEMLGRSEGGKLVPGAPAEPAVIADLDEATATQVVWLHNEIADRMGGDAQALFDVLDVKPGEPLRVASIDIGGGTTDLMVVSYRLGEGDAVIPKQEFRESFKTAGDDLLRQVIAELVVPALATALKSAGVADPAALLKRALGGDQGGQSEQDRHLRRQFVSQVLEPAGLAVLHAREKVEGRARGDLLRRRLGDLLGARTAGLDRALQYLERAAREAGATAESLLEAEITATVAQLDRIVRSVLGPVLANLCEAVWHLGCDVLLLSGRPSRLAPVADAVLARVPVAPHRVVQMHRYRVSEKYPFRDASNRIDDPKTTAAVGAMLCLQAETRLRNFHLQARHFGMRSTARFIGRLDQSGQLRDAAVLLRDVDLEQGRGRDVEFTTPLGAAVLLGFRQLPIERWTAQPLYALELADPQAAARLALPLRVTIRRQDDRYGGDGEDTGEGLVREMFAVETVTDANGEEPPAGPRTVRLQLQTMERGEGYWRDTGNLELRGNL
jgi:hypothetical protein